MSNLKQIGLGFMMYIQDYDGHMPSGFLGTTGVQQFEYPDGSGPGQFEPWYVAVWPYFGNWQVLNCPSADSEIEYKGGYSITQFPYAYNNLFPVPKKISGMSGSACSDVFDNWNCGVSMGPNQEIGASIAVIESPSETIMVTEGSSSLTRFYYSRIPTEAQLIETGACSRTYYFSDCLRVRHFDTMNTLFVDGHVKSMNRKFILGSPDDPNVVKYWTTASNPLH